MFMKTFKYSGVLVLLLAFTTIVYAQSREKIKGNRIVTIKQTYLNDFNTLIVKDNFEVKLAYNSKPSIEIETDDNLHDVIDKDVSSGVLTISTSRRITSKKKLEITVYYGDSLRNIQLQNSGEVQSLTSLELKTDETTRAYLNVKSKMFKFTGNGRSKSRLNITADSTSFIMSDNSRLDALINGKSSTFDMYQSADAKIEGDV